MKNIVIVALGVACVLLGLLGWHYHGQYIEQETKTLSLQMENSILQENVSVLESALATQNLYIENLRKDGELYQKEIEDLRGKEQSRLDSIDFSDTVMGTEGDTCEGMIDWMRSQAIQMR